MAEDKLKNILNNWRTKANNDLKIVEQNISSNEVLAYILCFHCQQAVEKFLKLFLIAHKIDYPKTHNIAVLIEECRKLDPAFEELSGVAYLTEYSVELRYPDEFFIPEIKEL